MKTKTDLASRVASNLLSSMDDRLVKIQALTEEIDALMFDFQGARELSHYDNHAASSVASHVRDARQSAYTAAGTLANIGQDRTDPLDSSATN